MRREKKLATSMISLFVDSEYQKLCDELHEIKLSHKRMERLLRRSLRYINSLGFIESDNGDYDSLCDAIVRELSYPYYRANYKVKGNKNG